MAGCGLAPAALSDALAPLADSARVETDQSDQQIEGPSSVAANTPASLADSDSAAGNVPALCAGQQDMCLTSVAGNAPESLAGSASAAGSVPVDPSTAKIVSALGAKKVARKLQTSFSGNASDMHFRRIRHRERFAGVQAAASRHARRRIT